ncbi:MAG: FG-GAP repeat domain-containing protein, partial [Gaiellaceae bacterium]
MAGSLVAALVAGIAGATDPTFTPAPGSPVAVGTYPESVAVADLNGDGKPDLAVANAWSDDVSILFGNGAGGFSEAPGSPVAVRSFPIFVAATELNG